MKRKRGRPKGKKYSQPRTTAEAFDIATYGKVAATEAASILRGCPYPTIKFIAETDPETVYPPNKTFMKLAPRLVESWAHRISECVGQKIASGDVQFFRQLADVVEEFSKTEREIESPIRYLAIGYKLFLCDLAVAPFTRKGLRDFYRCQYPGQTISSSTLSKLFRWAQSARPNFFDVDNIFPVLGPPRRRSVQKI